MAREQGRILEHIHYIPYLRGFKVRVWAKATALNDQLEVDTQVDKIVQCASGTQPTRAELCSKIAELDFCNAVEVYAANEAQNITHTGSLIYPDWP